MSFALIKIQGESLSGPRATTKNPECGMEGDSLGVVPGPKWIVELRRMNE